MFETGRVVVAWGRRFGMNALSAIENRALTKRVEKAQSVMAVLVVIPGEELLGERTAILDGAKAFPETRLVYGDTQTAYP
jgi:hypothetical protein